MSLERKVKKLVKNAIEPIEDAGKKAEIRLSNLASSKARDTERLISDAKDASNSLIQSATKSALVVTSDLKNQANDVVDSTLAKIMAIVTIAIIAYATYFFYKQKHIENFDPTELVFYVWSGSTIVVLITGIVVFTRKKSLALKHYFKWITSMVVCLAVLAATMYVMKEFIK